MIEFYNKKSGVEATRQIVRIEKAQTSQTLFDDFRQVSPEGQEFWSARDLQKVLEYRKFQDMEKSVLSILDEMQYLGELTFERKLQINQTNSQNPKAKFDYILSRLACYKLAMRGETEACKRSRTYFAVQTRKQEVQEQPQPKPTLAINADFLEQVAKKMRELEEAKQRVIEETKPAVEFTLQVQNSINSVTVADFAKAMGSGQIRFYTWLREKGYLMNSPKNRPYQNYIDSGYFKVIEKTFTDQSTGESRTYFQTLITGKGQTYLAARWEKQQLALN